MRQLTDSHYLLDDQYKDSANFNLRLQIIQRLSSNPVDWYRWIFEHFKQMPQGHVLELGAGPGYLWQHNLDRIPPDWQITLSDFSPGMIREAREALQTHRSQFAFQVVDIQDIPFAVQSFDAVIADHMLYHVPDLQRALAGIQRILKLDGTLYAATVTAQGMEELDHLMQQAGMESWMDVKGFSLENGNAYLTPWFANVQVDQLKQQLIVREAEPLIDLVRSSLPAGQREGVPVRRFRELVEQRLAQLGPLQLDASIGLFIASGKQGDHEGSSLRAR